MVYRPYYYTYYDYPYFESKYISCYNKKYSPNTLSNVKLIANDGTIIEGYSESENIIYFIVVGLIILFLMTL
jgi:hypothetical protein